MSRTCYYRVFICFPLLYRRSSSVSGNTDEHATFIICANC